MYMMKIFYVLIISLFMFSTAGAQTYLKMSQVTAQPGETVEIDVFIGGIDIVSSTQLFVTWDPDVIRYQGYKNLNTDPNTLVLDPEFIVDVPEVTNDGLMYFSSEHFANPAIIGTEQRFITLEFEVIGSIGESTDIDMPIEYRHAYWGDIFRDREVSDGDANLVDVTIQKGKVTIGQNSSNLNLNVGTNTVPTNQTGCVSITANGFQDITQFSFSLNWDSSIASFENVSALNSSIPGFTFSTHFGGNTGNGVLTVNYSSPGGTPITLPTGAKLFDLCLKAIATTGGTNISVTGQPMPINFTSSSNTITVVPSNGRFNIQSSGDCTLTETGFEFGVVTGQKGEEVCVPVTSLNFTEVITMFGKIKYDQNALLYKRVQVATGVLDGFNAGSQSFQNFPGDGVLAFAWNDSGAECQTRPDGTLFFNVCFEILVDDGYYPIYLLPDLLEEDLGVIRCDDLTTIKPWEYCEGAVSVSNGPGLNVVLDSLFNPCPGLENGRIYISATGGVAPYNYSWEKIGTGIFSTQQDVVGLGQGSYSVTVTDGASNTAILTQGVVTLQTMPILATANILNATSGNNGSITLNVSGGTAPYRYLWRFNNVDFATSKDISNLAAGSYTLLITDANNCTYQETFTITDSNLNIESNLTHPKCSDSSDGSIEVNAIGQGNFSYLWLHNNSTGRILSGVPAGTYSVRVTNTVTGETGTFNITLIAPPAITIQPINITAVDAGSDGAITINPAGGTPPYQFEWSNAATTQNISNLNEGIYYVTVTDANSCNFVSGPIVVSYSGGLEVDINITHVKCFGGSDGQILVMPLNGIAPFTYVWSNNPNLNQAINHNLIAGEYELIVTDNTGNSFRTTIIIEEPKELTVIVETNDATVTSPAFNGNALAIVSGGVSPYTYRWNDKDPGSTTAFIANLRPGAYSVFVTDNVGCTVLKTGEVFSGNLDCFTGRPIITPNSDGKNDNLVITCISRYENRIEIFDRFGQKVYEAENYSNEWEGTKQDGSELPDGVYFYVIFVKDQSNSQVESVYKGNVSIVRTLR